MQVRIRSLSGDKSQTINFEDESKYKKFIYDMMIALSDASNTQIAVFSGEGTESIFPSLVLKNSIITFESIEEEVKADISTILQ